MSDNPKFEVGVNMVLIHDLTREVLLLRKNGKWLLPGGRMHKNESVEDCIRREVREETKMTQLKDILPINARTSDDFESVYIGFFAVTLEKKVQLSDEHDKFEWVAEEDLDKFEFWHPALKNLVAEGFKIFGPIE